MSGIPDDASLEDQLKWRRFADRVDRLFKPSGRKRAELAKALAAYAAAAREARRLAYELWSSETEWFEGCKRQAADEQAIDLEYDPEPDPDPKLALSGSCWRSSPAARTRCWSRRKRPICCRG